MGCYGRFGETVKPLFDAGIIPQVQTNIFQLALKVIKKGNMEDSIISKAQELDESEIKALIENFETIGIILKEHHAFLRHPMISPESKKIFNEGLVLIKSFTQKCLEHYGMRYL